MLSARLYFLQRLSAMFIAPLVLGHLAVMIYAVRGGLSGAEILSRTQGSVFWGLVYGVFVLAVAVHGAIGLRINGYEWLRIPARWLQVFTWLTGLVLLVLGLRAVVAVVF